MKIVILAGGFGTRISEESHLKPKPMIEIGDAPILWHIMKYYSCFGFNDFIICCGYKGYVIKEYFADYYLHRSDITFDFSNGNEMIIHNNVAEPWRVTVVDTGLYTQTGGRIKRIKKYIGDETFMMTYGDGVSNIDIHKLVKQHKSTNNIVTLSAIQPGGRFGVLDIDENDRKVIGFREKATEDAGWINAGFMVLEPAVFNYIKEDKTIFEREPLESLSAEEKLGVYKHYGFWQCMDTQRDKYHLESMWGKNMAPWKVW
ncbi:MAG TPA: glucose-1-phosphate cytidylyltransferase [Sedimentibacter sp.]|nr:glucose-1-phosphate cytidylyltransferase [Sedimentibacter sp.]HPB79072.1 glucose-1-phosphate cytidylyltransferase [Sedimentibacter sp.]HPY55394.1 glucose-1-phosphate cytidylyltransferase [Sedimentibacter sp.]HQC69362.1 glucose-1-phosphate cytidylyltransferase [Sedimentibacter sp.]HQO71105.1 glucose-1-phosphate cytidylyltransferase [Sedimentibacter sp.]